MLIRKLTREVCILILWIAFPLNSEVNSSDFSDIIDISNDPNIISTLPSIAVDQDGFVHVAFWGTYDSTSAPDGVTTDIFYLNNKLGYFCSPIKIKVPSGYGYYSKDLTLAVDREGYAYIAFRRSDDQIWDTLFDDIFYATNRNSDISNAELVIDGGNSGGFACAGPRRPAIAVDDSNRVHIIYLGKAGTQIYYIKKTDSSFSTAIEIPGSTVWSVNPPSLTVDKQGFIHIAFKGNSSTDQWGDIFYITNASGEFEKKVIPSDLGIEGDPTIALDSSDSPHIVFNHYNTIYYSRLGGSQFSPPQVIGSSDRQAANPYILIDKDDFVHVMCEDDNYITNCTGNFESYDIVSGYYPTSGKHKIGISSDKKIHFSFHHSTGGYNYDIYYVNFDLCDTCQLGDVTMDGDITPEDALCVFQTYLQGGTPPEGECNTDCAVLAGDANCDNDITPGDALVIFTAYLNGLTPPLDCPPEGTLAKNKSTRTVKLVSLPAEKEDELKIGVRLDESAALQVFGMDLGFSENALEFVSATSGNATKTWQAFGSHEILSGVLRIGGFHDEVTEISGDENLVELTFRVRNRQQEKFACWLYNLTGDIASAEVETFTFENKANQQERASESDNLRTYRLGQNYPNPFNMETVISYEIPEATQVAIKIYNVNGQVTKTLINKLQQPGSYQILWNGKDERNRDVVSGLYFFSIETTSFKKMRKMTLIK